MLVAIPSWIWATLIMAAFDALTVFTIWLVRFPTQTPPQSSPTGEDEQAEVPGTQGGEGGDRSAE